MKKIIISILGVLSLFGCVDLKQEPLSFLTPENVSYDESNMTTMANGLYRALWGWNYGYCCRLFTLTLGADDVIAGQLSKTRVIVIDELRADATISELDVKYFWTNMYNLILNSNLMIEGISGSSGSFEEKKPYLGEAYFMRAFAYYNLVRIFGDVPAIIDSKSAQDVLGNENIGRNRVADIYDKIIVPDLIMAEEYLPEVPRTRDNSSVGKIAAQTCLSEVYLTMAGWPLKRTEYYAKAAEKAKQIIEASYNTHRLVEHYEDLWKEVMKSDNTEHIFAINCSRLNSMASQYGISFLAMEENGWSDYLADEAFYLKYPDDERKAFNYKTTYNRAGRPGQTIIVPYTQSTMKSPFINKYRDYGTDAAQSDGIIPIYRYADVLLIYAEAQNLANNGPDDLAYRCINDVRKRATGGTPNDIPENLSGEDFDKYVFDERGWEFFAEFKRWFQLVRREKVEECNRYNSRVVEAGYIDRNKENYLMPLPPKEVELAKFPQNAGY
ncbi:MULTISPECIES: RagB/SusD family nutrient uptake outer membrane protein [Bacteroidales]|uniref:RagB/SusD family nutrient uptake outer membrane protein n=1 Tax=Bacteroidales TaxID=171549 RepID=UPI0006D7778A|nr:MULTISPECIES: RagB/SusD family nutrient uptake outer membrane protein [Bacteroidales]